MPISKRKLPIRLTVILASMVFHWAGVNSAFADDEQEGLVAIVAHLATPVNDLSINQLRQIFLAEQQFWNDKSRITILIRAPTAFERTLVLNQIYRMSEQQFRQYWIGKLFRAEVSGGPKIVFSSEMALELITAIPGSITFMPVSAVNDSVKLVSIDGKLPGDPEYPL
ncbi:hypothetical protein MnTg02_00021 [bacterium MnTg02]|nr:hypothetical protein MnTg02_00021 [bacterium MnTg02]